MIDDRFFAFGVAVKILLSYGARRGSERITHLPTKSSARTVLIYGNGHNLVSNGSFENNGGVGELASGTTYATDWTVGATGDGSSDPAIVKALARAFRW
jgi:hypothetical protein